MASTKTPILVQNGTVVNDDCSFPADVYIENGIIKDVGKNLDVPKDTKIIDATDKLILPGGIDPHTHMQLPYYGTTAADDFYTGTRAALAGGTTMIIDYALDFKNISLLEAYNKWREWADGHVCCDYGLHVGVSWWSEQVSKEMEILTKEKGVNSFKAFMTFKEFYMVQDFETYAIFRKCNELGALGMVFPGNGHLEEKKAQEIFDMGITGPEGTVFSHSEEMEAEGVGRGITIAELANCPLMVVHVMSKTTADKVAAARKKGSVVFGEPVAASIGTDGSHYWNKDWRHAAAYVMSPPINQDPTTGDYLLDLLANDDLQTTGTDHVPFNADQKALGRDDFRKIPHGCNGVEDRMSIIWEKGVHTGKFDPCRFVAITSTNAAKIYNIYPQKGRIAVGSDADVVVWDPNQARTISVKTHQQACDFNIFEGMSCHGVPVYVIANGVLVVDNGKLNITEGAGRFIPLPCNCEYLYSKIRKREEFYKAKKVEREPYEGPVVNIDKKGVPPKPSNPLAPATMMTNKRSTNERDEQNTTEHINGENCVVKGTKRAHIRVAQPPGGAPSSIW